MKLKYLSVSIIAILHLLVICAGVSYAVILDTYLDDFDDYQDQATIHGAGSWRVVQGDSANALTQSAETFTGLGKSLKIMGDVNSVHVSRDASYGNLTPTWIRFSIKPGYSGQNPSVPVSGIAAVCFSYYGKILVSDGTIWLDTGKSYNINEWYEVTLRLNFKTHRYDLYVNSKNNPDVQFTPVKTDLRFINTSVNSLSRLKLYGAYFSKLSGDVYVDEVSISYADKLEIISIPQELMMGQPSGPIIVQLQNSFSEPQIAMSEITLELKSSSSKGKFSLNRDPWINIEQLVIFKNAQQAVFYYKDTAAGKPIITVAEYPEYGITDALQEEKISADISCFDVKVLSPIVAGDDFLITIKAKDDEGNMNESYAGSILIEADYISPTEGSYEISPKESSGFSKGELKVIANYPDCGLISITVTDSENLSKTGTSPQILFLPASFSLTTESEQIVSKPFDLTVTAKNAQGITAPNYNSMVSLYPAAILPLDIPEAVLSPAAILGNEFKDGAAEAAILYNLYGKIKIRAEDFNNSVKQGISGEINFLPKGVSVNIEQPSSDRGFFYVGEPVNLIVEVQDEIGSPIPNYSGIMEFTSQFGFAVPADYIFTETDKGQHKFTVSSFKTGNYTITAKVEARLQSESSNIEVKDASIQVIDAVSPVGSGEIIIQLVDELGNVITSENDLIVNITAVEDIANNSVSLPSAPITFKEGKAVIPVFNSEAETVTIIPASVYKINIKKGSIVFGKAGKSGIGTLMWRELKGRK